MYNTNQFWKRIMKRVRQLVLILIILLIAVMATGAFVSYRLTKQFTVQHLRNVVTDFVEQNFDKAIRFDSIKMGYKGNIVITNLKISAFSDFNDNILLVDSPETVIELNLMALLNGEIHIVNINSAQFTIHKSFDAEYGDAFSVITGIFDQFAASKELSKKKISLKIRNSQFTYSEIYRNEAQKFTASTFNLDLSITRDIIEFSTKGAFNKKGTPFIEESPFSIKGALYFNEAKFHGMTADFSVVNLDLSYQNPYLLYKADLNYEMYGAITSRGSLNILKNNASLNTDSIFTGLSLKSVSRLDDVHAIIVNKNMRVTANMDFLNRGDRFILHKFLIDDENLHLVAEGEYVNSEKSHYLKTNVRSNRIDLNSLSESLKPVKNISYTGGLQFDFSTDYDFNSGKNNRSNILLHLNNFSAERIEDGVARGFFKNTNAVISGTEKQLNVSVDARSFNSDYRLTLKSDVDSWAPLAGNSVISIKSDQLEASLIVQLLAEGQEYLESVGLADTKEGYDGVMFPDKEYGKFLTNNSIKLSMDCKKLLFHNNAAVKNIVFKQVLEDKMSYTETFNAEGYGAEYILDLSGNFKGHYAVIKANAGIYNFDLQRFHEDTGSQGEVAGILRGEYQWRVEGYRLRELVLQNRSSLSLSLRDGYVKGTRFQDEYYTFLASEGVTLQPETVDINELSYRMKKQSLSYYNQLSLSGKAMSFSARGPYLFQEGYNMPVTITVTESDGSRLKRESGYFRFSGTFLNPVLESRKNPDVSIELFR
jgi:hypothetical protein